jgi:NAD(P)-dependent dehydrogenase (short-subunit alcohol dehydrogenase family)
MAGKVCVVTGATGIAEATAIRFVEEGASLFVASLLAEDCEALAARLPDAPLRWVALDLTDEKAVESVFEDCVAHYGRVDALFGAVGGSGRPLGDGPLHEVTLDGWRRTAALNGEIAFMCAREATKAMRSQAGGGSIVLVSSVAATDPVPGIFDAIAYAAAKGAVNALVINGASHYGADGIRFNAIAPGFTLTPMATRAASDAATLEVAKQRMSLAGGGPLDPIDHAELAVFLCSDESRHVTGQVISVDGGWGVS